jgi:heme/copper-type cytochrome/quinol oxidase subunit 2
MRGVIVVEKEEEYKKWLAAQTPEYITLIKGAAPATPAVDSGSAKSKPMAQLMPEKNN